MFRKAPDRSMVKARVKAVLRMSIELHLSDCAKKLPDEMQREMMTPRSRRPVTMALQPPEEALKDSDGFKVGTFQRCSDAWIGGLHTAKPKFLKVALFCVTYFISKSLPVTDNTLILQFSFTTWAPGHFANLANFCI